MGIEPIYKKPACFKDDMHCLWMLRIIKGDFYIQPMKPVDASVMTVKGDAEWQKFCEENRFPIGTDFPVNRSIFKADEFVLLKGINGWEAVVPSRESLIAS